MLLKVQSPVLAIQLIKKKKNKKQQHSKFARARWKKKKEDASQFILFFGAVHGNKG